MVCFCNKYSSSALNIARKNALQHRIKIDFFELDILSKPKLDSKFDIIVSNPPYIPLAQIELMSASTIDFEPSVALFVPNEHPLQFYISILDFAQTHLAENEKLYLKMNGLWLKKQQHYFKMQILRI